MTAQALLAPMLRRGMVGVWVITTACHRASSTRQRQVAHSSSRFVCAYHVSCVLVNEGEYLVSMSLPHKMLKNFARNIEAEAELWAAKQYYGRDQPSCLSLKSDL